ncbi:MAG TPA: carbon monoxide dehydrogenase subunit G [Dongiaceae bacterium]|nr:carbon monoxide dehydrogenase subunit G [Dongiaceae bacterium]
MDMTGEYLIAAPRDAVWAALNDPEILKSCIAGCEELVRSGENEFTARVTAKIGPVKAGFGGKVTLSDIDPPNGYTITGEGQGGAAGFAKGGAKVVLVQQDGGKSTLLKYTAAAQIGGKLAQIGSRLVEGSAKKMADEFFAAFAARVGQEAAPAVALDAALEQLAPAAEATHGGAGHADHGHDHGLHGHGATQAEAAPAVEEDFSNNRQLVFLGGIVVIILLAVVALTFL